MGTKIFDNRRHKCYRLVHNIFSTRSHIMVPFYYRVFKILLGVSQCSVECTARPSPDICLHWTKDEQYKPQVVFDSTNATTERTKITRILAAPYLYVAYLTTFSINKATVHVTYSDCLHELKTVKTEVSLSVHVLAEIPNGHLQNTSHKRH